MREKTILADIYPSFTSNKIRNYISLTKPRLLSSVIFSAALGYIIPIDSILSVSSLLYLLLGTALLGGGAHTLNQWQEQVPDSKMNRTRNRPLPMGKVSSNEALFFGIIISIAGMTTLWFGLNSLTSALGILTLLSYAIVYTPLKQKTVANTWFGGITGALPPVMGWAAARGQLDWEVLPIFALLYFSKHRFRILSNASCKVILSMEITPTAGIKTLPVGEIFKGRVIMPSLDTMLKANSSPGPTIYLLGSIVSSRRTFSSNDCKTSASSWMISDVVFSFSVSVIREY